MFGVRGGERGVREGRGRSVSFGGDCRGCRGCRCRDEVDGTRGGDGGAFGRGVSCGGDSGASCRGVSRGGTCCGERFGVGTCR